MDPSTCTLSNQLGLHNCSIRWLWPILTAKKEVSPNETQQAHTTQLGGWAQIAHKPSNPRSPVHKFTTCFSLLTHGITHSHWCLLAFTLASTHCLVACHILPHFVLKMCHATVFVATKLFATSVATFGL